MESADHELEVLRVLCERVGGRALDAPDSGDFLGWHAGTMEYWLHALIAAEARRLGAWASRTEVPYITTARVGSKRGEKWSDGVVGWPEERFGALVEAKALVAHSAAKLRGDIRDKVAPDLDAMLGIARDATIGRAPGAYEDPGWAERRPDFIRLYALQVVLVHGVAASTCEGLLADALEQGVTRTVDRYADARPSWLVALQRAYAAAPLFQREGGEGPTAAFLSAWAVPLPWNDTTRESPPALQDTARSAAPDMD